MLEIRIFGGLALFYAGEELPLPSSRKTRALAAYLLLASGRHSRQALCDLFWDSVDDPLAGLRWGLSKLRPLLNAGDVERLLSDRSHAWFDPVEVHLDRERLVDTSDQAAISESDAEAVWEATSGLVLDGCDLPNLPDFSAWIEGQRNEATRLRARLARRFAKDRNLSWQARDTWAERWTGISPFSHDAAVTAFGARHFSAGRDAAAVLGSKLTRSFLDAGLEPPKLMIDPAADKPAAPALAGQRIRFVEGKDNVCIAWASVGDAANPPLVKAANWLNHLELDWEAPIWSPLFRELSRSHRVIRYDERGCGLSDWDVENIGFDEFVEDLEQVVDVAGLERFPLLGISQGAAVSIAFAAKHPERVSKLVIFGGYDTGWRYTATPDEVREREAVMVLTETGWGSDNPAYRHMFSRTFMPDANAEEYAWFDEFQRLTTSPRNAVRFLEAFSTIDVRDLLAQVQCPTLVVHSRGDLRIPFATGRSIAARIPDAELVGLDSNNHLLLGREKASEEFVERVRAFLADDS